MAVSNSQNVKSCNPVMDDKVYSLLESSKNARRKLLRNNQEITFTRVYSKEVSINRRSCKSIECASDWKDKKLFGIPDEALCERKNMPCDKTFDLLTKPTTLVDRELYRRFCRSLYVYCKNRWLALFKALQKLEMIDIREGGEAYKNKKTMKLGKYRIIYNSDINMDDKFWTYMSMLPVSTKIEFKGQSLSDDSDWDGITDEDRPFVFDYSDENPVKFGIKPNEPFTTGVVLDIQYGGLNTKEGAVCCVCNEQQCPEMYFLFVCVGLGEYQNFGVDMCDYCCVGHGDCVMINNKYLLGTYWNGQAVGDFEGQGLFSNIRDYVSNGINKLRGLPSLVYEKIKGLSTIAGIGHDIEVFKAKYDWVLEIIGHLALIGFNVWKFGVEASVSLMLVTMYNLRTHGVTIASGAYDLFSSICKIFSQKKDYNLDSALLGQDADNYGIIAAIATLLTTVAGIAVYKDKFSMVEILNIAKTVVGYGNDIIVKGSQVVSKLGNIVQSMFEWAFIQMGCPLDSTLSNLYASFEKHCAFYSTYQAASYWAGAFMSPTKMKLLDDEIALLITDVSIADALRVLKVKATLTHYLQTFKNIKSSMNSTYVTNMSNRPVPVTLQLQGKGGVGKTTITTYLHACLIAIEKKLQMKEVTTEVMGQHVYSYRNRSDGKDTYMTGLKDDHFIVDYPEMGQKKDDFTNPSLDIETLMSSVDTSPWRTAQSESIAKGNVAYSAKYITITTNLEGPWHVDSRNWQDPMAIHRRLHLNYTVTRKSQYESDTPEEFAERLKSFRTDADCPVEFNKFIYVPRVVGSHPGGKSQIVVYDQPTGEKHTFKQVLQAMVDLSNKHIKFFKESSDFTRLAAFVGQSNEQDSDAGFVGLKEKEPVVSSKKYFDAPDSSGDLEEPELMAPPSLLSLYSTSNLGEDFPLSLRRDEIEMLQALTEGRCPAMARKYAKIVQHTGLLYVQYKNMFVCPSKIDKSVVENKASDDKVVRFNLDKIASLKCNVELLFWFSLLFDAGSFLVHHGLIHAIQPDSIKIRHIPVVETDRGYEVADIAKYDADAARLELVMKRSDTWMSWIFKFVVPMFGLALTAYGGYYLYNYFTADKKLDEVVTELDGQQVTVQSRIKNKINDILENLQQAYERFKIHLENFISRVMDGAGSVATWINKLFSKIKSYFTSKVTSLDLSAFDEQVKEASKECSAAIEQGADVRESLREYGSKVGEIAYERFYAQSLKHENVPRVARLSQKILPLVGQSGDTYEFDVDAAAIRAKTLKNLVSFWVQVKDGNWRRVTSATFVRGRTCVLPEHAYKKLCSYNTVKMFRACSLNCWSGNLKEETICTPLKYLDETPIMDLCLVTWRKDLVLFADITKHFVREADLSHFENVPVTLSAIEENSVRYDDGTDKMTLVFKEYHGAMAEPIEHKQYVITEGVLGDSKKCVVTIAKGWQYEFPTRPGDCGGALTANNRSLSRKILGIHTCGNDRNLGASTTLTYEVLMANLAKIDQMVGQCIDPFTTYLYYDNGEVVDNYSNIVEFDNEVLDAYDVSYSVIDSPYLGSCTVLGKSKYNTSRVVNKIVESPIFDKMPWKNRKVPAVVTNTLKLEDGTVRNQNKFIFDKLHAPAMAVDVDKLCECAEHAMQPMYRKGWKRAATILSIDDAVFGTEADEYKNSINVSASAGKVFEQKKKGGANGKKQWINLEKRWIAPELREACDKQMEEWKQGIRQFDLFSGEKKVELRVPPKHLEPRLYNAGEMATLINSKRLFGSFISWRMKHWLQTGVTVGLNPYKDFGVLGMRLQSKGNKVFAGDFKKFDGSLQATLLYAVFRSFINWYKAAGIADEWIRAMWTCSNVTRFYVCQMGDDFILMDKANPSGGLCTSEINSFAVLTALRYVWAYIMRNVDDDFLGPQLSYYSENVAEAVNGDDNAVNISDICCDKFNQVTVAENLLKLLGMTYTDEAKTDKLQPYVGIKDITYLKRHFTDKEFGTLDKTSIEEIPLWMKRGTSTYDNFLSSLKSALIEASLHGREYYEYYRNGLVQALRQTEFYKYYVWTWSEVEDFKLTTSWLQTPTYIA